MPTLQFLAEIEIQKREIAILKERIKELEQEHVATCRQCSDLKNWREWWFNAWERIKELEEALENIVLWAKGSTCEICGEKKMTDTDAYDYAKAALEQKE